MKRRQLFLLLALCLAAVATASAQLSAQQPPHPSRPAYDGADALNAPLRIYVDQDCHILPDPLHPLPGQKQKPYRDGAICYVEGQHTSLHREERIDSNQLLRWDVSVIEQTFQLTNIADREAIFVVSYPVEKPWFIDSDPQPVRYDGNNAIFFVHVRPGERVGLHVGRRIMKPLKPKSL
jgi:hypothetical protein